MLRNKLMAFAVLAAALVLPNVARAQQALGVNYFDNSDGTVRISTSDILFASNATTGQR